MDIKFDNEELEKIEILKSRYPEQQAALMGTLWLAQKKFGWLSKEVMAYVAELLNLPLAHVEGVATFYTMYHKKPMGRHHIQVCTNVSCMLRGGNELYNFVSEKLALKHNQATEDGRYSLEEVECMGACGGAPMVAINEEFYENLDVNKLKEIIESLD